jgi:hypothetical protein
MIYIHPNTHTHTHTHTHTRTHTVNDCVLVGCLHCGRAACGMTGVSQRAERDSGDVTVRQE